jgi:GAF domain-containing protein
LLDIDRQWFKSRVGLEAQQTPRDDAFCSYTILEETSRVMVVPNALEDPRFANNPLVLGYPDIRFYAGASIIIEGIKIGTLCLIDRKPWKEFSIKNQEILIDFADTIGQLMSDKRKQEIEVRYNLPAVYIQQSILCILQEPIQSMRQSSQMIQLKMIHFTCHKSNESKSEALEDLEDALKTLQADILYFHQLLDRSLRAVARVVVNPETG